MFKSYTVSLIIFQWFFDIVSRDSAGNSHNCCNREKRSVSDINYIVCSGLNVELLGSGYIDSSFYSLL